MRRTTSITQHLHQQARTQELHLKFRRLLLQRLLLLLQLLALTLLLRRQPLPQLPLPLPLILLYCQCYCGHYYHHFRGLLHPP